MMKRTSSIFGLILAVTFVAPAVAQIKTPAKAAPQLASIPAPQLTEVEKLKLENIQLKFSMLQTQQQQLQAEYQADVQAIIAQHPGYTLDPRSAELVAKTPDK